MVAALVEAGVVPGALLERDRRQAVAAALDRQQIIDSSVFGYGEPLVGMYPPDYWAGYQGEVPAPHGGLEGLDPGPHPGGRRCAQRGPAGRLSRGAQVDEPQRRHHRPAVPGSGEEDRVDLLALAAETGATGMWEEEDTAHLIGGCRMGSTPADGVTNSYGRTWAIPNLWICDGSLFPTSGGANPSLTIMALAMRSADSIATRLRTDEDSVRAFGDQDVDALVAQFDDGRLPAVAEHELRSFLARYGHRAVAEIDLGMPRWSREPDHILGMISNYLRVEDPEQAPDRQFARAAQPPESLAGQARIQQRQLLRQPAEEPLPLALGNRVRLAAAEDEREPPREARPVG